MYHGHSLALIIHLADHSCSISPLLNRNHWTLTISNLASCHSSLESNTLPANSMRWTGTSGFMNQASRQSLCLIPHWPMYAMYLRISGSSVKSRVEPHLYHRQAILRVGSLTSLLSSSRRYKASTNRCRQKMLSYSALLMDTPRPRM